MLVYQIFLSIGNQQSQTNTMGKNAKARKQSCLFLTVPILSHST